MSCEKLKFATPQRQPHRVQQNVVMGVELESNGEHEAKQITKIYKETNKELK